MDNRKKLTAADATRFPRLYRATYWGAFRLGDNPERITPGIVENRNRFAEGWRLARQVERLPLIHPILRRGEDYDHPELYRDAERRFVFTVSNYGDVPPPPELGMKPIPPIYGVGVGSWAARFASRKELNARLLACTGHRLPLAVRLGVGVGNAGAEGCQTLTGKRKRTLGRAGGPGAGWRQGPGPQIVSRRVSSVGNTGARGKVRGASRGQPGPRAGVRRR